MRRGSSQCCLKCYKGPPVTMQTPHILQAVLPLCCCAARKEPVLDCKPSVATRQTWHDSTASLSCHGRQSKSNGISIASLCVPCSIEYSLSRDLLNVTSEGGSRLSRRIDLSRNSSRPTAERDFALERCVRQCKPLSLMKQGMKVRGIAFYV